MLKLPRVILADDHMLVAEALRKLIDSQFDVVAIASDGHQLLELAASLRPDVIVVDVAMPLLNGLEAGRQLKQKMPGIKLVYLTMNEDPELALEAMKAGASGYVLKRSAASELVQALSAADVLNVTPRTVAFHKYRLMQDHGLKTNADVIQFAIKSGIVV